MHIVDAFFALIWIVLAVEALGASNTSLNVPQSEMDALFDLYTATHGENWIIYKKVPDLPVPIPINLSAINLGIAWNFSAGANPCTDHWQGINCTKATEDIPPHISVVHLTVHNLVGTLPSSISNLSYLEVLSIPYNHINGTFPTSICNLSRLIYIDIDTNQFSGTIPDCLGTLTQLQYLFLYKNRFTGTIPASLGDLDKLLHLGFNGNQLTQTIPETLGNLANLQYLDGDSNLLTGTLPEILGSLTQLLGLNFATNRLTGSVPLTVGNLSQLLGLYLNNNTLTGEIPYTLDALDKLQYIVLDTNFLTGTMPNCIGDMTDLEYLGLNNNFLSGTIPVEIAQLPALKILLLQENNLRGALDGVFDHTMQAVLQSVVINSNQLTGELPGEVFLLPQLTSFVAVSNCFWGELPGEVCQATAIVSLVLDGLSSATSCRNNVLRGVSQSYTITKAVKGKIPPCVYALPNLTTLHLSGNGFTGSFADDLILSDSLIDLSLSHNKLTGDVPAVIQRRQWHNLDLSYNRFDGSLHDDFGTVPVALPPPPPTPPTPSGGASATFMHSRVRPSNNKAAADSTQHMLVTHSPADRASQRNRRAAAPARPFAATPTPGYFNYSDTSLSLENNRLSGRLPQTVLNIADISVLGSNLFSCSFGEGDLPSHDSGKSNYQCGSTAFDIPYYVWLGLVATLATLVVCVRASVRVKDVFSAEKLAENVQLWLSYSESCDPDVCDTVSLVQYTKKLKVIARVTLRSTAYIMLVLFPLLCVLSVQYGTVQHQYAWTASAAYLSGWVPLAWLLPLLVVMLVLLMVLFLRRMSALKAENKILSRETVVATSAAMAAATDATKTKITALKNAAVYITYIVINTIVVVGVNVVYVYVAIYESNSILPLAQVLLSLFKLYWNSAGTAALLSLTVNNLTCGGGSTHARHENERKYSETHSLFLQIFVAQLNNIVIPCFVVAVISPNCFYNIFVAAPDVDSSYYYEYCDLFTPTGNCVIYSPKLSSTSYDPPFSYNYQCSSSLITYYGPAFVLLCLVSTFVMPCLQLAAHYFHRDATPGTAWHRFLEAVVPALLKALPDAAQGQGDAPTSVDSQLQRQSLTGAPPVYFPANRVLLTLFTYLGMLLTFGAMFPPLAVALAVTIYTVMYFARLKVGYFLHQAVQKERFSYVGVVMRECQGVGSSAVLISAMWMLITVSCWFYTLFLFDTLGDAVGFHHAYWVLIVVPLQPLCMYGAYQLGLMVAPEYIQRLLTSATIAGHGEEERETDLEMTPSDHSQAGQAHVFAAQQGEVRQLSTVMGIMHHQPA